MFLVFPMRGCVWIWLWYHVSCIHDRNLRYYCICVAEWRFKWQTEGREDESEWTRWLGKLAYGHILFRQYVTCGRLHTGGARSLCRRNGDVQCWPRSGCMACIAYHRYPEPCWWDKWPWEPLSIHNLLKSIPWYTWYLWNLQDSSRVSWRPNLAYAGPVSLADVCPVSVWAFAISQTVLLISPFFLALSTVKCPILSRLITHLFYHYQGNITLQPWFNLVI